MVDDTYMVNMSDTSDLRSLPIYILADKPVANSPFLRGASLQESRPGRGNWNLLTFSFKRRKFLENPQRDIPVNMSGDFSNAKTDYNDYNIRKRNEKIPSKCNDTHFCESHVAKDFGHQKKMAFPLTPPTPPQWLCGLPPRYKVMRIRPTLRDHQWFFGPPICGFCSNTLGPWVLWIPTVTLVN